MNQNKWFSEVRFGMFIHWGLYALPGRGEWVMYQENIPVKEYNKLAGQFNPRRGCAEEWVALAKEAGMKYMVLTTRHHDGFCLFNTRTTDFNAVATAPGRDLVAEYVQAVRRAGLKVGLYYSLGTWLNPMFQQSRSLSPKLNKQQWQDMVAGTHAQLAELCRNYGRIDLLWYDGGFAPAGMTLAAAYESKRLNAMVRRHQPGILINDRSGLPEDFDTPEQHCTSSKPGRLWEACMTMNMHWGYFKTDHLWKYSKQMLHLMTGCASAEGNYLLNVGPKPDGTIPAESAKRLREMGRWMKVNGEAIYGSQRAGWDSGTAGVVTRKGKKDYLIVHWWSGTELALPIIPRGIRSAYMLATGKKVNLEQRGQRLVLTGLPAKAPDELSTVIVMER